MQNSQSPKKSRLEALAERIYSRTNPPHLRGRRRLRKNDTPEVARDVDPELLGLPKQEEPNLELEEPKQAPLTQFYDDILEEKEEKFWTAPKLFLAFSVLFFFLSAFAAYFLIISGFNEVSSKNIKMVVKGPSYVESGELMQLQVFIENLNNSKLDTADLIIDYPLGTLVPNGDYSIVNVTIGSEKQKAVRQRVDLRSIDAGELKRGTVRARLFGEKIKYILLRLV